VRFYKKMVYCLNCNRAWDKKTRKLFKGDPDWCVHCDSTLGFYKYGSDSHLELRERYMTDQNPGPHFPPPPLPSNKDEEQEKMTTEKITDVKEIRVTGTPTRCMERALENAQSTACNLFGINETGNSDVVEGWQRSSCAIRLRFKTIECICGSHGQNITIIFDAWCERTKDPDNDER